MKNTNKIILIAIIIIILGAGLILDIYSKNLSYKVLSFINNQINTTNTKDKNNKKTNTINNNNNISTDNKCNVELKEYTEYKNFNITQNRKYTYKDGNESNYNINGTIDNENKTMYVKEVYTSSNISKEIVSEIYGDLNTKEGYRKTSIGSSNWIKTRVTDLTDIYLTISRFKRSQTCNKVDNNHYIIEYGTRPIDVYIDNDGYITKIITKMELKSSNYEEIYEISNINKADKITIPEEISNTNNNNEANNI